MYDNFLLKTVFFYDLNNSERKLKNQVKKNFFYPNFCLIFASESHTHTNFFLLIAM
jgi:hypothetical protein